MGSAVLFGVLAVLLAGLAAGEAGRAVHRRRVRRLLARLPPPRSGGAGPRGPAPPGARGVRLGHPAAALLAGIGAAVLFTSPAAGVVAAIGWPVALRTFRRLRDRREREAFQAALPGALELVARALRAGQPLDGALVEAARSGPRPVAAALGRFREDLALGAPFDVALRRFGAGHRGVPEVQLLVAALILGRETGGQLADLLDRLARTVRRRVAFRRELAALLAEGRATAWVLGSLPAVFLVLMAWLRPGHLEAWVADPTGRALLGLAVALEGVGFACMRLLTRVEP